MFKHNFLKTAIAVVSLIAMTGFASAINATNLTAAASTICNILQSIYGLLIYIVSGIAVLTIVIQGIMWVSSGDNAKQRHSAKDGIVHVIVGLIIIGVAISVVILVLPSGSDCIANW